MKSLAAKRREKLLKRLSSYWQLEALNVIFVPAFTAILVIQADDNVSWPLGLSMVACSGLLIVGAIIWRLKFDELQKKVEFEYFIIPWLDRVKFPSLWLCLATIPAVLYELIHDGRWSPSVIATTALATLSIMEWINYYAIQLQHFDHIDDFQRLIKGKGFR
jgi:hypothetical protein